MLCVTAWSVHLWSQEMGVLEGTVLDRQTSERLPGATLQWEKDSSIGVITGGNGRYKFKLPVGKQRILVSFIGYKDTTLTVQIQKEVTQRLDVLLAPDLLTMETLIVDANMVAKEIENLAALRDRQKEQISGYKADVHKVAVLSYINEQDSLKNEPFAYSERVTELIFKEPNRYAEVIKGRRASKNFFSEFDFFATGGGPLDLNRNKVSLSVLSEDLTIVGPVSTSAQDYYFYDESKADSSWPEGTILYKITPKKENAPLFFGKIWINKDEGGILGIDVGLNEFVNTTNGLYSVSNVHYKQSYEKIGKHWFPDETTLEATIGFLMSKRKIRYTDVWSWDNYQMQESGAISDRIIIPLDGEIVDDLADKRESDYWNDERFSSHPQQLKLQAADTNQKASKVLATGMKALSLGYRIPGFSERFFVSQIDDWYRFNRVEGHYAGLGIKTPDHPSHRYKAAVGYSFGREQWQHDLLAEQYVGYTGWGITAAWYNRMNMRYVDRFDYVNPLYMSDFRFGTFESGMVGLNNVDYYRNEGWSVGLKKKWWSMSFVELEYARENHDAVNTTTSRNIFGRDLRDQPHFQNERSESFTTPVQDLEYIRFQWHHDTRKYQPYMLIRDYTVRSSGWVSDLIYEHGIGNQKFARYRGIVSVILPTFFSSQLELSLFMAAANQQTPNQLLYGMNGWLLDDYVLQQPFLALPFNEAFGQRSSVLFAVYRFGTAFSRAIPIEFIRKSGVRFTLFASAGFIDQNTSMSPLVPGLNYDLGSGIEQAEIGAQMTRIFGVFYVRVSRRILGDFGSEWGFQAIF